MGNNPSKSHQLQSIFPQFKIIPELSLSSDNEYELIFVNREGQKGIYAIKETLKEPALLNYLKTVQPQVRTYGDLNKCSEVAQILECKKIDSMFYTLYEWLPMSLPSFLASISEPLSRSLCIYIMLTLLKVYAMLWKNCEGCGLDIRPNNIRVVNSLPLQSSLPCIKVLPPSITHSFSKKEPLNNSIQHLGEVLAIVLSRGQNISDIITFINKKMRAPGVLTNFTTWEALQKESSIFTQPHPTSFTPIKREQEGRSVSPIPQNLKLSPLPLQPGHIATITRPISPISVSRVSYSRDLSPQQSRVSTYKNQYQPHNNIKIKENIHRTSVSPVKIVDRVGQFKSTENNQAVKNAKDLHQPNEALNLHQRYPSGQGSVISYNYSNSTLSTNKLIPVYPTNTKAEIYETNILDPESCPKLNPLSPSLIAHSPFSYDKHIATNNKMVNQLRNENGHPNFTPQKIHSHTNISTPKERNFNIPNHPTNTVSPAKNTQNVHLMHNVQINQAKEPQLMETRNQITSSMSIPSMFTPSLPDPIQIRSKIGVPSLVYVPKTSQDKHNESEEKEEKKESCKSSLNLFGSGENFIEKHLMTKNESSQKELLGSSIPVVNDKESSFGLTVSQDSDSGINYEGIYEGSFHSNFPTIRHGVGKLIFPSGGSYQGNFSWNKMDGWGKLFYPSGRLAYEGYWKHSKFEGYGKLFNENPIHIDIIDHKDFSKAQTETEDGCWKYYEGNMKNDMKEGHGIWVMENGEKYDGEFHLDMVHGIGIFHGKKGNIEGIWENNIFIGNSKKPIRQ